ncbi:MAG: hypothetical protein WC372_09865 [Candidatus Neomarinimicrobiota bacterium]
MNDLVAKVRSLTASKARDRAESKLQLQRYGEAACNVAGGGLGGLIDGYFGGGETHEILGVPTALGAGAIVAVVGLLDVLPGSEYVANIGTGTASYGLGVLVRDRTAAAKA